MRKVVAVLLSLSLLAGFSYNSFASDWDVAGKVLTGLEGLRILSGGKFDPIGNIGGINTKEQAAYRKHYKHSHTCHKHCQKVWVPNYKWKKKWIPAHKEYHKKYGEVLVEGHYIKYKVKHGGYWDYDCSEGCSCRYSD